MKGKQKKTIHKKKESKKEIKEEKHISFCPVCNSTFVYKIISHTGIINGKSKLPQAFKCNNCGHIANTFPEIEANKINTIPPVKIIKKKDYYQFNNTVKYDPVNFVLTIIVGIILLIFGAYLLYESLVLASIMYATFSIIGGISMIIISVRHRNTHGIKK
jgi:hypothetical protein